MLEQLSIEKKSVLYPHQVLSLHRLREAAALAICKQQQDRLHRLPSSESLAIATILGKAEMIINACNAADEIEIEYDDPYADIAVGGVEDMLEDLSEVAADLLPALSIRVTPEFTDHVDRLNRIIRKEAQRKILRSLPADSLHG